MSCAVLFSLNIVVRLSAHQVRIYFLLKFCSIIYQSFFEVNRFVGINCSDCIKSSLKAFQFVCSCNQAVAYCHLQNSAQHCPSFKLVFTAHSGSPSGCNAVKIDSDTFASRISNNCCSETGLSFALMLHMITLPLSIVASFLKTFAD